jgi:hypothetical protein
MTTTNPALGHETRDISISGVVVFLVGLAFSFAVVYVLLVGVFKYANHYLDEKDKKAGKQNPWVQQEIDRDAAARAGLDRKLKTQGIEPNAFIQEESAAIDRVKRFPQPRLQDDDVREMEALRASEDAQLNNLYYTDKEAGKVNIPIDQAMQMVVQRGLPVLEQASKTPQPAAKTNPEAKPAPAQPREMK